MKPTIRAAHAVCDAMGARQVVVVAFGSDGRYAVVSYGDTRAECSAVKPLCDAIADALGDGTLPRPVGLLQSRSAVLTWPP